MPAVQTSEPVTDVGQGAKAARGGALGDMDARTAGMLEIARGLGTSGVVMLLFYQMLTTQVERVSDDVTALSARMTADVASLNQRVSDLQLGLARVEVKLERDDIPPAPVAPPAPRR
jgi:hypothetical protein